MKIETIFHPTDFSAGADKALHQTACLAQALEARVELLHKVVYRAPESPSDILAHLEDADELDRVLRACFQEPEREAAEALRERVESLRNQGLEVEFHLVRSGDPLDAILERIDKAKVDLVVMSTHGRTGLGRLLMGSLTEKVLRHAPVNVLTLREDSTVAGCEQGLGPVLVPVDFSDHSQRAVGLARHLIERIGGSLRLLHVVEPVHSATHTQSFTSRLEADPSLGIRYREALESMLADDSGEVSVREGNVGAQILLGREEMDARLVVMGTRGLSGPQHFLMGSVAEKVVRFCEVPVLTVK